jgi:hypothetical protein
MRLAQETLRKRRGEVRQATVEMFASTVCSNPTGDGAVYDVAVEGMSDISSYRSQFNSILRRSSFAELLQRLQNREASVALRTEPGTMNPSSLPRSWSRS